MTSVSPSAARKLEEGGELRSRTGEPIAQSRRLALVREPHA
jgi:hypothetical protein